jgi:hypothetical protein
MIDFTWSELTAAVHVLPDDTVAELAKGPIAGTDECRVCAALHPLIAQEGLTLHILTAADRLNDWHDQVAYNVKLVETVADSSHIADEEEDELTAECALLLKSLSYARCCAIYGVARHEIMGRRQEVAFAQDRHVVEFRRDGWGLAHPIGCRMEGRSLLDCEVNQAVNQYVEEVGEGGPPLRVGRYVVRMGEGPEEGEPIFEALDE